MLGETLSRIPVIRSLVAPIRWRRARNRFAGEQYGGCFGVYPSFAAAIADVPQTKPCGYDQPALIGDYQRLLKDQLARRLEPYEAPAMEIVETLAARDGSIRVADLGGNLGTHFYAYRRHFRFPDALRWTVVDVPPICAAGKQLAMESSVTALSFVTTLDSALPADLLIASGSLFYLADPLALFARTDLPPDIILNRMPLGHAPSFVTLQNGGPVFYPQWILQRDELLGVAQRAGYGVVREWDDLVDHCIIPLRPELSVLHYSGLHLSRLKSH